VSVKSAGAALDFEEGACIAVVEPDFFSGVFNLDVPLADCDVGGIVESGTSGIGPFIPGIPCA